MMAIAIILLGEPVDKEDPMLGLGGSALLAGCAWNENGAPPRIDLEPENELHGALRSLIFAGGIKKRARLQRWRAHCGAGRMLHLESNCERNAEASRR